MALFAPAAQQLIQQHDPEHFITLVNNVLHSGAAFFRDMQNELAAAVNSVPDPTEVRSFLLECLGLLLMPGKKKEELLKARPAPNLKNRPQLTSSDALTFLLLDAVPTSHPDASAESNGHAMTPQQQPTEAPTSSAGQPPAAVEEHITTAALQLVMTCVEAGNLKPGIRVAQAYGLTSRELMAHPEVYHTVHTRFMELFKAGEGGLTSLAGMIMQFDVLGSEIDIPHLITDLVRSQKEDFAEKWILERKLGLDEQVAYIDSCLATGKFKAALRVIRTCRLTERYQEVEQEYCRKEFAKLMEKGNWQTAARFVGTDKVLQEQLVAAMVVDEPERAQAYVEEWGLSVEVPKVDPAARAAAEAARAAQFHGLALPLESVLVVNDMASLQEAHRVLAAATVVGLDAEWRPRARRAALLQIATPDRVFLFDFQTLLYPEAAHSHTSSKSHSHSGTHHAQTTAVDGATSSTQPAVEGTASSTQPALEPAQAPLHADPEVVAATDDCLVAVFQNQGCLKVGLEVGGDLRKLAGSCPGLRVWSGVGPVLEIRDLWVQHLAATNPDTEVTKQQQLLGLSNLCAALHGKPLDKTMQMSDWGRRPLSQRQVLYAAQDAHVLVTMYERLRQLVPHADQVVADKQFTYHAKF